jgi:hypothetical protein
MASGEVTLRPYRAADRDALRAINIRTAYRNRGAAWLFEDTELHADYWTRYYTDIRPADIRIVEIGGEIAGYFLAGFDHRHFVRSMARQIIPAVAAQALWRLLRGRYRRPESRRYLRHMLLVARSEMPDFPFDRYPAHYHCNLTRRAYGRGLYTRLVLEFLDALEARGITRLHGSITEPRDSGIWQRSTLGLAASTGAKGPPVVAEVFAEKPTRLFEAVLGDPTPMVNRTWGTTTAGYRIFMGYLRDEMRL